MNSILVIQLKRLGDVILTTPALSELRKLYPEAQITLLLDHHSAALAPLTGGATPEAPGSAGGLAPARPSVTGWRWPRSET